MINGLLITVGVLFLLNVLKSFFLGEFLSLFINPNDNLPGLGYSNDHHHHQSSSQPWLGVHLVLCNAQHRYQHVC